jgi:hypothetical protein
MAELVPAITMMKVRVLLFGIAGTSPAMTPRGESDIR